MFSSVTSWLGVVDNKKEEEKENADTEDKSEEDKSTEKENENSSGNKSKEEKSEDKEEDSLEKTIEDVSAKAINTAKEWGSFLYSFSKTAGKTVADKAMQISKQVEEKTFLGDFSREQNKFVSEKKEKEKHEEAAVPPWIGYNEEEAMKSQILALSKDRRNFMRNPPSGVQYQFDFTSMYPIAMATLQEDSNLQKMRFELVPKQISEETFWKNYFYRVSLIKQSTQLTSLAQETGSTGESKSNDGSRRSSTGSVEKEHSKSIDKEKQKDEDFAPSSPNDHEFVSDSFQDDAINDEDMRKEMQMLGMEEGDKKEKTEEGGTPYRQPYERNYWKVCYEPTNSDNIPQWEKELQQELQDFELVDNAGDVDDADIENEILQQIEKETNSG